MPVLIVIPARLKATRLPNKPLAMIGDAPMIVQVWRRACEAHVGEVIVACDGEEIAAAVRAAGGVAVLTDPELPSGSDRVWEGVLSIEGGLTPPSPLSAATPAARGSRGALRTDHFNQSRHDIIINLQGDLPTLEPRLLRELLLPLENPEVDIATLVAPITRVEEHENPSVVKAVLSIYAEGGLTPPLTPAASGSLALRTDTTKAGSHATIGRALYFTRCAAPYGEGERYHHIGVYAYRRAALERFVALPPSTLEKREKLEQLRALEAGMRIDAVVVDTVPLGVDTPEDLERARLVISR